MGATYCCYRAGEEGGGWVSLSPGWLQVLEATPQLSRSAVGACWATLAGSSGARGRHAGHLEELGSLLGGNLQGHQLDPRGIPDVR